MAAENRRYRVKYGDLLHVVDTKTGEKVWHPHPHLSGASPEVVADEFARLYNKADRAHPGLSHKDLTPHMVELMEEEPDDE